MDEIRCARGKQQIYLRIREALADGRLLGEVVTFGDLCARDSFGVGVGDVVEIPTDRILAVLLGGGADSVETPQLLLQDEIR